MTTLYLFFVLFLSVTESFGPPSFQLSMTALKSSSSNPQETPFVERPRLRDALNLPPTPPTATNHNSNYTCRVVGHRGALYQHLENTLPGFQYCLEIQCDAVELDVYYLPLCNELVVFHGGGTDEIPGDLTDYCVNPPKRSILELSWDEVQQLQFNPNYPELVCPKNDAFNNAKIPTLRQVLELYRGKNIVVKIELKGPDTTLPVLKLVEELDMVSQCHFSSFHHDRLQHIRHLHPERHANGTHVYQTGALFFEPVPEDFVEQALKVGASEVHLRYDTCTLPRIHAIHEAGMTSMAWLRGPLAMMPCSDVQEEDLYRTLLETGVQQLCCNRPDVLLRVLGRL